MSAPVRITGGGFVMSGGLSMLHDLVTTTEAAEACGVGRSTISMWVARGHLKVRGLNEHNHPVYRLGDVLVVARDTRRRAVGTRRIA